MGYGVPLPVLSWKHNEAAIQNGSQFSINEYVVTEGQSTATFLVSSLEVCNSELEDAGNFSCTSRNALGNEVYTSVLTVIAGECFHPQPLKCGTLLLMGSNHTFHAISYRNHFLHDCGFS